jgi:hypothetical protein
VGDASDGELTVLRSFVSRRHLPELSSVRPEEEE